MSGDDQAAAVLRRPTLGRIVGYYVAVGLVVAALVWRLPAFNQFLTLGRLVDAGGEITRTLAGQVPEGTIHLGWAGVVIAGLSLLGALVIMIPVAWTYTIIKRRSGYDESVVHTLLILPIAVTGIVLIVRGSLPLAFSLAGIVAAVRFRTTLDDTKDAVYVFLAIGVGLASGVQALGVAAVLSLVFNGVNLILWRMNFGNIYADQFRHGGKIRLGDAVAGPESARTAMAIGDSRLVAAMSPTEVTEVADRMARTRRYLEAESSSRKERKRYSVLMIYTAEAGGAQAAVEPILERMALRWSLAEVIPGHDGVSILEYLVRVPDEVPAGAILDAIRAEAGALVRAAELRSLRGLAKKGT